MLYWIVLDFLRLINKYSRVNVYCYRLKYIIYWNVEIFVKSREKSWNNTLYRGYMGQGFGEISLVAGYRR
jgi:hypothetical protein